MLRDASRAVEGSFAEMIETGRRRGELPADVAAAAHFLVTTLQEVRVLGRSGHAC